MDPAFTDRAADVFREHVSALAREVGGAMREEAIVPAVEELMRLLAVSGCEGADAAGEVLAAVRSSSISPQGGSGTPGELEARLGRLRLLALSSFAGHRARITRIRERELERAGFVERRARERKTRTA